MQHSSKPPTAGLRSRKEMAAPPGPWAQSPRDVMNMVQGSLRMDRAGQEGREGGREGEDSVCEQHSTRVNKGKHTWRRGCVERESLKEMRKKAMERERKGGCAGGRKMLLPGNCSELRTSIFSSSGEDKNNTSAKWTEHQEGHNSWSWAGATKEKVGRCGCVTAIWHHNSGIRDWGGNISVGG